jgi:hypothetical protein
MAKTTIERQNLIEAVNALPDEVPIELASFVEYLRYKTVQHQNSEPPKQNFLLTVADLGKSGQAEFLHQKQLSSPQPQAIPPGTLTGLRGIAKRPGTALNDEVLQADYTDYLTQKYQ